MTDMNPVHHPIPPQPLLSLTRGPVARFALASVVGAGLVMLTGVALAGPDAPALTLATGAYILAAGLALALMRRGYPHSGVGLCNLVTLARLALASALLVPLAGTAAAPWAIFAVAAVALSLDGIDGWLARREGRVSAFGARFDMEVDSALALILAVNAFAAGTAGVIVLLIGIPRYAFVLAGLVLPWLDRPVPERLSRKVVCVVQIATLIFLQLPPVASTLANPVVAVVASALVWSFGRDVAWLWRNRV